jgi:hypothetical protein
MPFDIQRLAGAFESSATGLKTLKALERLLAAPAVRTVLTLVDETPDGSAQLKAVGLPR